MFNRIHFFIFSMVLISQISFGTEYEELDQFFAVSESIANTEYIVESTMITYPMFSNEEDAYQYSLERLSRGRRPSDINVESDEFKKVLEENIKYFTSQKESRVDYICKLKTLDEMLTIYNPIDSKTTPPGYHIFLHNYIITYQFQQVQLFNRNAIRNYFDLFALDSFHYNLTKDNNIKVIFENDNNSYNYVHNGGKYTLQFNFSVSKHFPVEYIHETEQNKVVYTYENFKTHSGISYPYTFNSIQYDIHPKTNQFYKAHKREFELVRINDLKDDVYLTIEVPNNTSFRNHLTSESIHIDSEQDMVDLRKYLIDNEYIKSKN